MDFLIKNAGVMRLDPPKSEESDIRIADGVIAECGKNLRSKKGEEVVDCTGKFVLPGLVNAHTHLYSSLSRGMLPPKTAPKNFIEILQKVWWKLDEALDAESIYYSGLVGAIEAVKFGTTTLIDHHASPNHIRGSLDLLKSGMMKAGVRGILCYETTDRGGMKKRDWGLEENERFVTENANHPHFRGTIGAHASFTLCNDSLRKLGELASMYDCGVHIHAAEDKADVLDATEHYNSDLISRFDDLGILRRKSILAHGVYLHQQQLSRIEKAGAWVIHNPRSNMNNAVGVAPLNWYGGHAGLGTDGFPSDMIEEAKIGYFRNAESEHRTEFSRMPSLLSNGQKLSSEFFGRTFGTFTAGSMADLVVLDYLPPTPLTKQNLIGHFLFGINSTMVQHVMVDGRWIVWNKQMMGLDEEAVMEKARKVAQKLWNRMTK
ncbi:MAG: putative aminohydrolase SsnA [Ignavibacteriae bacterium]|nr:MAG: putative aminohydrolase SsnA [Ignavibacteriota bacterium]